MGSPVREDEGFQSPLEAQLVACVQDSLASYLYDNARFICERLVAEYPSKANTHLLATCYYRSDQAFRAYHLLQGCSSPTGRYLFALCCMKLPGKLPEAENALNPTNNGVMVPNGAAGHLLLGRIHRLTNRHGSAVQHFSRALQLDPLLWQAFDELCTLGADKEAQAFLRAGNPATTTSGAPAPPRPGAGAAPRGSLTGEPAVFSGRSADGLLPALQAGAHRRRSGTGGAVGNGTLEGTPGCLTPAAAVVGLISAGRAASTAASHGRGVAPMVTPSPSAYTTPAAAPPLARAPAARQPHLPHAAMRRPQHPGGGGGAGEPATKFLDEGKVRKVSNRLFAEPATTSRQSGRPASAARDTAPQPLHPNGARVAAPAATDAAVDENGKEVGDMAAPAGSYGVAGTGPEGLASKEGAEAAQQLLRSLGEGYRLLCLYQCQEAIDAFGRLSRKQYETGWVLCQVGRACFEMVDYPQAQRALEWARQLEPHRLEGVEVLSTVLWHLKAEVALSHLAQEAIAADRLAPQAWAVMGNCFSLQKEHGNALKFFQRALQLDPTFAYGYTLAGHEYYANEDFDKGLACYRNAVRIDPRHYNAWYGVGQIYFRQEKYEMAEYHFRRSLEINGRSSVLRCYRGMALHKLGRHDEALAVLQGAIEADPKNPLAKFELAAVLISQEAFAAALSQLEALKDIAPREASVYFAMGKIYKRLDMIDEALRQFSTALDLKPSSSDANLIKAAIERIRTTNDSEDDNI